MGKRMSFETAEKLSRRDHSLDDSIFISENKYGYKINISHPKIKPLYERYKRKIGCNILSDSERFQFESIIIQMYKNKAKQIY